MMVSIPQVLDAGQVARVREIIGAAEWIDGNATSGPQAALAKNNSQLAEGSAAALEAGGLVLDALANSALFIAAGLPLRVYPPLFNRYSGGQQFGSHVDNSIRIQRGSDFRIRSDLSATLFLADPASYDGGELQIEGHFGAQAIKLAAGDMVLYPSSSLHRVAPVTRGERVASFFWVQSMVREEGARRMLFELDQAVQRLSGQVGMGDRSVIELTGLYHNLLRRWADT